MNLHGIVRNVIGAVNPQQKCLLQVSTGYSNSATGARTPTYAAPVYPLAQVQSLSTSDIRLLDALNIQGSTRKIYMNGQVSAISRAAGKGGDLITLADGTVWLTTAVLEQWPDWCAVSVTLQSQIGPISKLDFTIPANAIYLPLL